MSSAERRGPRHEFACRLAWTGATSDGTTSYGGYSREYRIDFDGKPSITGSAATPFRGDGALPNPEDLLVASLSACHCLSYLALCARGGISVLEYSDDAWGVMEPAGKTLRFKEVVLKPRVLIAAGSSLERARALHEDAHALCFIAASVGFPVHNEPTVSSA